MRIDHRSSTNVRSDVDVHRWHAYHTAGHVRAAPNAGSSRHDAHSIAAREVPRRIGVLIEEREHDAVASSAERHVDDRARSKAKEYAAFHPVHRSPVTGPGIPGCGANAPFFQRVEQRRHDVTSVARQILTRGYRGECVDPLFQFRRAGGHQSASAPTETRAARTVVSNFDARGTSGKRKTFDMRPIIASAALTGIGFDSMKAAAVHSANW